ncbi:hypothetical protein LIER_41444 [Lithospermum erythrorhizon]|uniref:Uncharacterized protein n=1 Tax=Lithospermum erythrorhizon TaxID=34254 RepID=A0AAV3RBG2_LITER
MESTKICYEICVKEQSKSPGMNLICASAANRLISPSNFALRDNEDCSEDYILERILTYSALESSPEQLLHQNSDQNSSDYDEDFLDDFSDSDNSSSDEGYRPSEPQEDISSTLYGMGYSHRPCMEWATQRKIFR